MISVLPDVPCLQDDESILYAQAEAAVAAALTVLGNGGALPAATAAAETAAADAETAAVAAAAAAGGGGGVDEFGRDLGLQRRQELQRGAARRQSLVAGILAQIAALQQGELVHSLWQTFSLHHVWSLATNSSCCCPCRRPGLHALLQNTLCACVIVQQHCQLHNINWCAQ